MVNFRLGNRMWKVNWSIHWAMKTYKEQGHLTEFILYVTGILHTATLKSSTAKIIVSSYEYIKMVNFKLGNKLWKVNWSTWCCSVFWRSWGTQIFFLCPMLVACWSMYLSHIIIIGYRSPHFLNCNSYFEFVS